MLSANNAIVIASFPENMKAYLFLDVNAPGEKGSTSLLLANIYRGFMDCHLSSAIGQEPGTWGMNVGCPGKKLEFLKTS